MSNVEMLLVAMEREEDDLTTAAALTEALMEERGMQRSEAERCAERAMQAVRDGREMKEAARILEPLQPWNRELMNDILYHCSLTADTDAQIVLVIGDREPSYHNTERTAASGWWYETTVTVGALWLIRYFRRHPSLHLVPATATTSPSPRKRKPR